MEEKKIVIISDSGLSCRSEEWHEEHSLAQLQAAVGGFIEIVRTQQPVPAMVRLLGYDKAKHIVLVVDEEGLLKGKRYNLTARWIVGYPEALAGPAVVMYEGYNDDGEPDLLPLTADDAAVVLSCLGRIGCRVERDG